MEPGVRSKYFRYCISKKFCPFTLRFVIKGKGFFDILFTIGPFAIPHIEKNIGRLISNDSRIS